MTILDVWHTSFTVSDLDRSVVFYRDVLGLQLRQRQDQDNEYTRRLVGYRDASLRVAQFGLPADSRQRSGHILELVEYLAPIGHVLDLATANVGVAHLAFEVEDLFSMYARLKDADVSFVSEPVDITEGVNRGGRTVYFRDPDGITLEMVEPPALKSSGSE
jgi:catechol 2,3-dioxygenase-like lactoylglutathione lyase family enzyme